MAPRDRAVDRSLSVLRPAPGTGRPARVVALGGLYARLRTVEPTLATASLVLTLLGAVGSLVHGGYDLAAALHPTAAVSADAPNAVDPRGVLTFGVAGIGFVAVGVLARRVAGLGARFRCSPPCSASCWSCSTSRG